MICLFRVCLLNPWMIHVFALEVEQRQSFDAVWFKLFQPLMVNARLSFSNGRSWWHAGALFHRPSPRMQLWVQTYNPSLHVAEHLIHKEFSLYMIQKGWLTSHMTRDNLRDKPPPTCNYIVFWLLWCGVNYKFRLPNLHHLHVDDFGIKSGQPERNLVDRWQTSKLQMFVQYQTCDLAVSDDL